MTDWHACTHCGSRRNYCDDSDACCVECRSTAGYTHTREKDGRGTAPRCQYLSPSPWGPAQCVLEASHEGRHAYSPSEAIYTYNDEATPTDPLHAALAGGDT